MSRRTSTASGLVLAAVVLLAGCQTRTETTAESNVTISGPTEAVERFASLQASRTPALDAGPLTSTGPGTARIEFVLDETATGDDAERIGREAIAAGLTYAFSSSRTVAVTMP